MPESESERLKRLRQRQLADRDPLVKQRQFERNSVAKEKRMQKPFSFAKAWNDISHSIKMPLYALIVGVIIIFVLPNFWKSSYAILAGVGITLVLIILGVITGSSLDLRDNIRKHIK
jgi:predicted permease